MAEEKKKDEKEETQFSKLNFDELAPELQPFYKSMQADYTKKTQEAAEIRKQIEADQKAWLQEHEAQLTELGSAKKEVEQWRAWSASLQDQGSDQDSSDKETGSLEGADQAYADLQKKFEGLREEFTTLQKTQKRSTEEVSRMFKYQDELGDLKSLHPTMDKQKVIDYMMEKGIVDPEVAYKEVYQDDIIAAEVDRQVEERLKEEEEKRKADMLSGPGSSMGDSLLYRPSTMNKETNRPMNWDEAEEAVIKDHRRKELGLT